MANLVQTKAFIALDYNNYDDAMDIVNILGDDCKHYKVGMELFYSSGEKLVLKLKDMGKSIFLDLKLYDIPNTMISATKSLINMEPDIINYHAQGGGDSLLALSSNIKEYCYKINKSCPKLIGVTVLTSLSDEYLEQNKIGFPNIGSYAEALAMLSKKANFDGVVSSVHEVEQIKKICGNQFLTITPGIRFADDNVDDQKRVATPTYAKQVGTDYIVVGRAVTNSSNPSDAYYKLISQLND